MAISRPDLDSLLRRITVRSDVFGGKPIIRDLRISVELIVSLLAQGVTVDDILDDYPALERDDVRACLAYARGGASGDVTTGDRVKLAALDDLAGCRGWPPGVMLLLTARGG